MEMNEEEERTNLIWRVSKMATHIPHNQHPKKHSKRGKNSKRRGE
jgi:hypothetical protein